MYVHVSSNVLVTLVCVSDYSDTEIAQMLIIISDTESEGDTYSI